MGVFNPFPSPFTYSLTPLAPLVPQVHFPVWVRMWVGKGLDRQVLLHNMLSVSYTHLDVYKRQLMHGAVKATLAGSTPATAMVSEQGL